MMSNMSTFDRKWLKWVVLLIIMAILLIVGRVIFADVVYSDFRPLTTSEVFTYEKDTGLFVMKFTALISFDVEWEEETHGYCWEKGVSGYAPFYMICDDFLGTYIGGLFVKKTSLENFSSSCSFVESYVAGNNYEVYMVDFNNPIYAGDSTSTIKTDSLRDKDEETDVDAESVFSTAETYDETQYVSEFYLSFIPEIDITYPLDESETLSNFEMKIDYSGKENYDRLMVVFEDWDIGSTCPPETDPNYQAERDVYFNSRSMPYFSNSLTTSTGTTTINVYGLEIGNYNCNKCFFVNDETGAISENLCFGYNLDVLSYLPSPEIPETYLEVESWENYYSEHSERFTTSTPIFNSLAETFSPLITWAGNTILFFNNYFDPETAGNKGEEIGNAVRVARGYLESIDDFFGGLPISTIFIFYLITTIVIIIYRLVKGILTIIIP